MHLTETEYTATQTAYAALNAERDFYHAMTGQWYTFAIYHQPGCQRTTLDTRCTCQPRVDKSPPFPYPKVRR